MPPGNLPSTAPDALAVGRFKRLPRPAQA